MRKAIYRIFCLYISGITLNLFDMTDLLGLDLKELEWYHMVLRAIIIFFIAMIFLRLAGRRAFGASTPFDVVTSITIGGIFGRAITGHYPFFACLAAALTLAVCHRIMAHLTSRFDIVRRVMEGRPEILFATGKKQPQNMKKHAINDTDITRNLRKQGVAKFDSVDSIWIETDGELSVVKKEQKH